MHTINTNIAQGRLVKNYLTQNFIARNARNLQYIDKMTISLFLLLTVVD